MLVHPPHRLPAIGEVGLAAEVERVLHLACGVVLRLEERVEVPEAGLDELAAHLDEAHLEQDPPHLVEEALVRVGLARDDAPRKAVDPVPAEGRVPPGAGQEHLVGDLPDLLAEVEAGLDERPARRRDRDPVADRLALDGEPALEEVAESRAVGQRFAQQRPLVLPLGSIAGPLHDAVADRDPALAPEPADPDRGERVRFQIGHRRPVADRGEQLPLGQPRLRVPPPLVGEVVRRLDHAFDRGEAAVLGEQVRILDDRVGGRPEGRAEFGGVRRAERREGREQAPLVQGECALRHESQISAARCATSSIRSRKSARNASTRSAVSRLQAPHVTSPAMQRLRSSASSASSSHMWNRFSS